MKYNIGDVISPKYDRHKQWPDRLIVGYDYDEQGNQGYLWVYSDPELDSKYIASSLNHSDTEFNIFWELKVKL